MNPQDRLLRNRRTIPAQNWGCGFSSSPKSSSLEGCSSFILPIATRIPVDFHHASRELEVILGTLNTLILLTSSLTMAISISAIQKRESEIIRSFSLVATIALRLLFLLNKGIEWGAKIDHGIYPNSPVLLARTKGEVLFFGLYYVMTGLHGLHVLVGVGSPFCDVEFRLEGKD